MCKGCRGKAGSIVTRQELSLFKQALWPADAVRPVRVYAVLDCARSPIIYDLLQRSYREKSCLFAGTLDADLERAAPHLVELHPGDSVTEQILLQGWEDAWGILIRSEGTFKTLRRHLRTLLRVRTEDGRFLLFRFYDPRVLERFLPTCTAEELALLFGEAVAAWYCFAEGLQTTASATLHGSELLIKPLLLQQQVSS